MIWALAVTGIVRLCLWLSDLLEREIREKLYDICLDVMVEVVSRISLFLRANHKKRMMRGTLFDQEVQKTCQQSITFCLEELKQN